MKNCKKISVSRIILSEIADFSPIHRQNRQIFGPKSRKIRQFLAPNHGKFASFQPPFNNIYPLLQKIKFYCIFMHEYFLRKSILDFFPKKLIEKNIFKMFYIFSASNFLILIELFFVLYKVKKICQISLEFGPAIGEIALIFPYSLYISPKSPGFIGISQYRQF